MLKRVGRTIFWIRDGQRNRIGPTYPVLVGKKQRRELRSRGLPGLQYPKVPHSWPGSQIAPDQ